MTMIIPIEQEVKDNTKKKKDLGDIHPPTL